MRHRGGEVRVCELCARAYVSRCMCVCTCVCVITCVCSRGCVSERVCVHVSEYEWCVSIHF